LITAGFHPGAQNRLGLLRAFADGEIIYLIFSSRSDSMGLNPFTHSGRGPKTSGALELEFQGDPIIKKGDPIIKKV